MLPDTGIAKGKWLSEGYFARFYESVAERDAKTLKGSFCLQDCMIAR